MKLFKKAAAVALAAALSLSMLTACGGGGASAGNLTAQNFGGSYTIKYRCVEVNGVEPPAESEMAINVYLTSDGSSTYEEENGSATLIITSGSDKGVYHINTATGKRQKDSTSPEEYGGGTLPMMGTLESGKEEYKGKTYPAESFTFTADGTVQTFSYCYENGKPAYIIIKMKDAETKQEMVAVCHVDEFSRTADTNKLKLSNYQELSESEDLFPENAD